MSMTDDEFKKILIQMKTAEARAQGEKGIMKSKREQMLEGFMIWLFYLFILILAGFLFKFIVSVSMLLAGIIFILLFNQCYGEMIKEKIKKFLNNEKFYNMFQKK